jgi:hypothetical protein
MVQITVYFVTLNIKWICSSWQTFGIDGMIAHVIVIG